MATVQGIEHCKQCGNMSLHVEFGFGICWQTGFWLACGYSEDEITRKATVCLKPHRGQGVINMAAKPDTGGCRIIAAGCRTRRGLFHSIKDIETDPNLQAPCATFFSQEGLEFLRGEPDPGWAANDSFNLPALVEEAEL